MVGLGLEVEGARLGNADGALLGSELPLGRLLGTKLGKLDTDGMSLGVQLG